MDEDAGVKALVTRLRRRLSAEQTEESKSPAVNTPTKKRGGRKTKPELEPVDENTPDNTTTRRATRKAIKDVIEPEEKPVTPSRRSTRIKSNTSIISETALTVDSPRAKRAARRASTAGSDNEAPITPARQTRRTRKDSASSVEKEPQVPSKQGIQITEIIVEEPEGSSSKSVPQLENTNEQSNSTNSTRRSPRLSEIRKKTNDIKETIQKASDGIPLSEPAENIPSQDNSDSISPPSQAISDERSDVNTTNVSKNRSESAQNRLSIASAKLIKELNTESTKKTNLNNSLSTVDSKESVSKRKRTKSWTTLSNSIDSQFYSDNEGTKSKIKDNIKSPLVPINRAGSGDKSFNTSKNQDISKKSILERKNSMNFTIEIVNESLEKNHENIEKESKDEMSLSHNNTKNNTNTSELLERKSSGDIKTMVFIEDSDSNSEKPNEPKRHKNEDQCVPVVEHPVESFHAEEKTFTSILHKNEQNIFNISKRKESEQMEVEPMDIDETIPENLIIPETDTTQLNTTERKSTSSSAHISNLTNDEIVNKSGRKSSISNNLEKSGIETKSTLILSQIKDLSAGDISNAVKSPQVTNNKLLSKSVDDLNITQENNIKKNVSLHYSTSTPLQDKNISQKFKGIHVSTPIVSSQSNQANEELVNLSKENNNISKSNNDEYVKEHNISNETVTANTLKETQGKDKKPSDKDTINFQSDISQSQIKEIKETSDKENLDKMNISEGEVLIEQQNENKSINLSLSEDSIKPASKDRKSKRNISSLEGSEEDIESLDNTERESHLLDDEAQDAGDDYESGDSQNESERQYEKDHEVIDKGETLTTDDYFSDDSDYEKDSFIVSSNEEDEELLDGTDDDLSMSDNELKMTAKSKKKYNKRKLKEQKLASREMFESRHKLNSLNKSTDSVMGKTKNNKRQQISSSESEEDVPTKSKKNNRMRLDSTKEASLHADESEHKISKKKNKVDTDSSSNESVSNENEMTIFNESIKENDPLTLIKTEPKTPLKSANSTIAFIDSEEINNDGIDKNESTKTQTEFDPLHATMFVDEDDDSISSDSEKIQNYDSVLQDLNKSNVKIKTKTCDISLSLDNKRKKNEKNTIVDELNLTQVKSTKKLKKQKGKDEKPETLLKNNEDDASDSIELKLLFSEESNNSDTSSVQNKMKADKADSEEIIPLKTAEAKTDLRENIGDKEECAMFFVDTNGAHADEPHNKIEENNYYQSTENINALDKSVNKSVSKLQAEENSDDEAPLEVSYQKERSSKRQCKIQDNISNDAENAAETSLNELTAKSTANAKKNKKKAKLIESSGHTDNVAEICINESIVKTPASAKKSKKKAKLSETSEQADNLEAPVDVSMEKKKKHKKSSSTSFTEDNENPSVSDNLEAPVDVSMEKKQKHKKSAHTSITVDNEIQSVPDNLKAPVDVSMEKKKKHKKSVSTSFTENNEIQSVPDNLKAPVDVSMERKKKHKKSSSTSFTEDNENPSVSDNLEAPVDVSMEKKQKHKKSAPTSITVDNEIQSVPDNLKAPVDVSMEKKKKHKKSASTSFTENNEIQSVPDNLKAPVDVSMERKKKHEKSASTSFTENNEIQSVPDNLEASVDVSMEKKKKLKNSVSTSFIENNEIRSIPADQTFNTSKEKTSGGPKKKPSENTLQDNLEVSIDAASTEKKKKKQNKSASSSFKQDNEIPFVPVEIAENETSSKKRKRISSPSTTREEIKPGDVDATLPLNNSSDGSTKKKRKVVTQDYVQEDAPTEKEDKQPDKKHNKNTTAIGIPNISTGIDEPNKKRNRKRKDRDEDEASIATSKMPKENAFAKVTRLPATLLEKLVDVPCEVPCKKPKVISTTEFIVQETNKRRVKPSNYLEESIYLHESSNKRRKNKKRLEKPKVLPFVPTASTSSSGFTTNFRINVLPSDITFIAQSNNVASFRENHLYGNNIRRLRTYDMYKRQRNMKLSKF